MNGHTQPWDEIPVAQWLNPGTTPADLRSITRFLTEQGTFRFPTLPNGLFSAAHGEGDDFELTGYRNVWLRDNVHVAWAHLTVQDDPTIALTCVQSLNEFYRNHQHRFLDIVDGNSHHDDPMNRPHIRFNGNALGELPEKWSHAQNDALGYWLWINSLLIQQGIMPAGTVDWSLFTLLVKFWQKVEVWRDEDSGHWEEVRKISASSIGCALAGLTELRKLMNDANIRNQLASVAHAIEVSDVDTLIQQCQSSLHEILPAECIQADPTQKRRYDGALLFLIYPLNILQNRAIEDQILADVQQNLQGPYGIRRYLGDSYWCADYRDLLSADQRTMDFSDSLDARDQLLKPGMEAQWCIFDPIVACIYGKRYQAQPYPQTLALQIEATRRSLSQLTPKDGRFPPWRCPESYFCEKGKWIPNDITPLLWTQGNLWQALKLLEINLEK